jgi:large subunit ribosomal protein L17e
MSNPCHIELILTEGEEVVQKSAETVARKPHLNSRQRARITQKAIAN